MQQYFTDTPLTINEEYVFTKQQAHHAKDVVRLDHETVRLVYDGIAYLGECYTKDGSFVCMIEKQDPRINELDCDITLCMALIRKEKFEFVLQKAAELGVKHIIPFESSRCIVHARKEKMSRTMERWNDILLEGSQQCKRNLIPDIAEPVSMKELFQTEGDLKLCAYENAYGNSQSITDLYQDQKKVLIVIGPEGGFSKEEVEQFSLHGYQSITLGSRILRAETAALYACSVLAEHAEGNK